MSASVLVVEDEPQIQELIAVNLEHIGHRVRRAATAEEAESAIRDELPDVVVLDWMLPGESGLSFARRLRAERPPIYYWYREFFMEAPISPAYGHFCARL